MNRYEKILDNNFIKFGMLAIASWLVISESYLWWAKLSASAEQSAEVVLQNQPESAVSPGQERPPLSRDASQVLSGLSQQAAFQQVKDVPEGRFAYGGSTTWAAIREDVDSLLRLRLPAFQLQYAAPNPIRGRTPGSGTGIRMVLDGELAFAQSSRPLQAEERAEAQRQGYALVEVAIAIDSIAVAVNPQLNIAGLTIEQLKQIYAGQITNWREVGGPDLPIVPYARSTVDSGTSEFFVKTVLNNEQFSGTTQFVESTTTGIRNVTENVGALYYASAPEIVGQCSIKPLPLGVTSSQFVAPYIPPLVASESCPRYRNQPNVEKIRSREYPLTRDLFVIVKANGSTDEQVGVAYANLLRSDEGQSLIETAGFVGAVK